MMDFKMREHTCLDEAGNHCTFQYLLLWDEVWRDGALIRDYGIMVRSARGESMEIRHISPDHRRISDLLTLLCQQGVSPIHLRDVIEDWL